MRNHSLGAKLERTDFAREKSEWPQEWSVVWGKVRGYPWWPGVVMRHGEEDEWRKGVQSERFWVMFIHENQGTWLRNTPNELRTFDAKKAASEIAVKARKRASIVRAANRAAALEEKLESAGDDDERLQLVLRALRVPPKRRVIHHDTYSDEEEDDALEEAQQAASDHSSPHEDDEMDAGDSRKAAVGSKRRFGSANGSARRESDGVGSSESSGSARKKSKNEEVKRESPVVNDGPDTQRNRSEMKMNNERRKDAIREDLVETAAPAGGREKNGERGEAPPLSAERAEKLERELVDTQRMLSCVLASHPTPALIGVPYIDLNTPVPLPDRPSDPKNMTSNELRACGEHFIKHGDRLVALRQKLIVCHESYLEKSASMLSELCAAIDEVRMQERDVVDALSQILTRRVQADVLKEAKISKRFMQVNKLMKKGKLPASALSKAVVRQFCESLGPSLPRAPGAQGNSTENHTDDADAKAAQLGTAITTAKATDVSLLASPSPTDAKASAQD